MSDDVLLDARAVSKRFGGLAALRDVDVVQRRGETLGMIGPNGSGKTTFVNVITGHLAMNGGTVRFAGESLDGRSPFRIARAGLTRTYQSVRIFGELSGGENVATALVDARDPVDPDGIAELADWLKIGHRLDVPAGGLKLDEQRRLELLMRLVQRPRLVMLDEPVGGLSSTEVRIMIGLLAELKARCTLFVIEHTMKVIRELADKVVVLVAGEKLAEGPPAEILADQRVIDFYLGSADA
ncbi:MAG: ABC transporter ATP-binding protein [Lautropia sp.]